MQEQDFTVLMDKIIRDQFQSEVTVFEVSGKVIINELFQGFPVNRERTSGDINFLEEGKQIISFIALLVSAYKTGKEIWQFFKTKKEKEANLEDIRNTWRELMVKEGISEDVAERVSLKYTPELIKSAE